MKSSASEPGLIQALPIFCYFLLQDFCDGGTLHEKIVSAREVSKSSKLYKKH